MIALSISLINDHHLDRNHGPLEQFLYEADLCLILKFATLQGALIGSSSRDEQINAKGMAIYDL
jgi:hypothetical protein